MAPEAREGTLCVCPYRLAPLWSRLLGPGFPLLARLFLRGGRLPSEVQPAAPGLSTLSLKGREYCSQERGCGARADSGHWGRLTSGAHSRHPSR